MRAEFEKEMKAAVEIAVGREKEIIDEKNEEIAVLVL